MNVFGNKIDSLLSTDRICNLIKYSNACSHLGGYLLECGTFRGGSLEIMARFNPGISVIGLDSFEGVSEASADDYHQLGDFSEVTVRNVIGYFSYVYPQVRIVKGVIPKAFEFFDEHTKFAFTHIDLDMRDAIYSSLNFILPRTLKGGMILLDDWKIRSTPGCQIAVEKFFEDHPGVEISYRGEVKLYDSPDSKLTNQYIIVM